MKTPHTEKLVVALKALGAEYYESDVDTEDDSLMLTGAPGFEVQLGFDFIVLHKWVENRTAIIFCGEWAVWQNANDVALKIRLRVERFKKEK